MDELLRETRGMERFADSPDDEFRWADVLLVRYRIFAIGILRRTRKDSGATLTRDLREVGKRSFPELQLLIQFLGAFPNETAESPA